MHLDKVLIMGDCASRPTKSELEIHMKENNSKNDRYFKYFKLEDAYAQEPQTTNLKSLGFKKALFDKKYKEFLRKAESCAEDLPQIREVLVEVQRGVNLDKPGFCMTQGKPYIGVSLEPNGLYQETFPADLFKPKWYRLIQFKTLLEFRVIKFTLHFKNGYNSAGAFEISISDIKDQQVLERWIPMELEHNKEAMIRIRVQYIENEKQLYADLADKCLKASLEQLGALKEYSPIPD